MTDKQQPSTEGDPGMEFFVFSYNRGRFLRNCIESLRRHAAHLPVTVIDDGSSDPEVARVLHEYADCLRVVRSTDAIRGHYLGGLYPNMNHALRISRSDCAVFVQDDMQVVRDVTEQDIEHVHRFFAHHPGSLELHCCFLKGLQGPSDRSDLDIDPDVPAYFRKLEGRGSKYFSAVGTFNVPRLRELGFEFTNFEQGNDARVREIGNRMGISPYPFLMWLPWPEATKFRTKGLLQRYAEWKVGAGFYPYRSMSRDEAERLRNQPLGEARVAEDWLDPQGMSKGRPWYFDDAAKLVPLAWKIRKMRKRFRRKILRRQ